MRNQHAPRAWKEKIQVWNWGIKTKTDAGRVSQYTSPLQLNALLYYQAIGGEAMANNLVNS